MMTAVLEVADVMTDQLALLLFQLLFATTVAVTIAASTNLLTICGDICRRLKIASPVRVAQDAKAVVPFACGWLHPAVILPSECVGWPAARWRMVLGHELAHICRHDEAWQSVARLACTLVWPHPLVWLAAWRMRVEREMACDDAVLLMGERPSQYADQLVQIVIALRQAGGSLSPSMAMAGNSSIERRIRSILGPAIPREPVGRRTSVLLAMGMMIVVLGAGLIAPADAKSPQDEAPSRQNADASPANSALDEGSRRQPAATESKDQGDHRDGPAAGEPLPDTVIHIHKNGSVTVTVDGKQHQLTPRQLRRRVPELLAGKEHVTLRMDEWKYFDRAPVISDLYGYGVRRLTFDSGTERRTWDLHPPPLFQVISEGNVDQRAAALGELETLFREGNNVNAMYVMHKTQNIRYDRSRFLPHVRAALRSNDKRTLGDAISTIAMVGGDSSDIPQVLPHVDHPDRNVRASVGMALPALDPAGKNADVGRAIVQLLGDDSSWVRTTTIENLWGCVVTPEVEAKLIQLSRGPSSGGSGEADIVIHKALATRPRVRKPVAERLIEIVEANGKHKRRAVWGLTHVATNKARPLAIDALIKVVDADVDDDMRRTTMTGLGLHGGEKAWNKLQSIALDPNEADSTRKDARRKLPAHLKSLTGDAEKAIQPPPIQRPRDLWRQIEQTHDPGLRATALEQVRELLQEAATAPKAFNALAKTWEVEFDRAALAPAIRKWLSAEDEQLRASAVTALGVLGPEIVDAAEIVPFARDDSPAVRSAAIVSLLSVDAKAETVETRESIRELLDDPDTKVVATVLHSLWGKPTTPAAEAAIIDLSYHPQLRKDAVYYALSTRPLKRRPVAERLIELGAMSGEHGGRAIWGLSHFTVAADAHELVVDAMIDVIDRSANPYDRSNAIYGLGQLGGAKARKRLQRLVSHDEVSEAERKQAASALETLNSAMTR